MTRRKIIGAKVRLLVPIENQGGVKFEAGEILEIWQSYYGYGLKSSDGRYITRVDKTDVEFIETPNKHER